MIVGDSETLFQRSLGRLSRRALTGPTRTQVLDSTGATLAILTVGSKTVQMRGQSRTFTEQKKVFTDDFQRTISPEWGQSPGGGTWRSLLGTESKFEVDGSKGVILMDAVNTSRWASLFDEDIGDVNAHMVLSVDEVPTGASCSTSLSIGYTGTSNNYRARLLFSTVAGNVQLALDKETGGVITTLGALTTLGTGFAALDKWHIRAQRTGTTVRCRAWKDGTSEPGTWTHSVTDTDHMAGRIGVRSIASTGNTNTPFHVYIYSIGAESCEWTHPPTVTHDKWIRVLDDPYDGGWTSDIEARIRHWAQDNSPDALAYSMMFGAHAPPVVDATLGYQVYGQAGYGPLQPDGKRFEFSDFNDYFGIDWDFPSGEHRDFPHFDIDETLNIDCSGFVRMVYGYRMGLPLTFDLDFDGLNIPRRSRDMGPDGPGIIVAQATGAPPSLSKIQIGDVVFFDADSGDEVSGQIDHDGIYIGQDTLGGYRFISSRKVADGPTFGDLGGPSLLDGGGFYADALRIIRRF
ncbi:NlpC/P60 family protein [Streptomyces sp. NBC_01298]|uniref:NlpC/P60 family protein n=1 Tax=Streptomyces sp. NBC_01298 TaxID=2903817 RepID=UPI002E1649EB|nr:NlpC/P60 family protein [Streptomyces sp. NBC_01298]